MMMANELPEDLVTQILLWLPVVSLLRFKCVCKSWYALVTHQNFIRKHLLHNKNKSDSNTQLLLKFRDLFTEDYVVSTISYETLQVSLTQPVPPLFSFHLMEEGNIFVVGCCDGLVCLHGFSIYHFNVVIWNPATKETKVVVPESNVHQSRGHFIGGIGFGFDAKTNDYKIIKILRYPDHNIRRNYAYQKVVYSLSSDSWRKVDGWEYTKGHFLTDECKGQMTYINGMASWRAAGEAGDDWAGVLSFDMSEEVFLETPLPDDVMRNRNPLVWDELFVLNQSIGMAVRIWSEDWLQFHFDIWSLLEVGVKDSWTKLFTIGESSRIIQPLGFWKNDTMFFENSNELVLYDPSTKQITNLQFDPRIMLSSQLVTYMETLVSVKGGNQFEEQDI
jgi:F-box interacting protein